MPAARTDIDIKAEEILSQLDVKTYQQVSDLNGISRGKIYKLAVEHKRRKNEARIQERANERRRRQHDFLQEVINASSSSDVQDFLDGLPDETIDLHITSIPYNVGKEYGGAHDIDRRKFHFYLGWLLQVLSEMTRTLKEGGTLFLQVGSTKDDNGMMYPLDILLFEHLRAMGLSFQSRVAWVLPHGLTPKARLSERYETALVFSKGESTVFNANAARIPQKQPKKRAFKGANKGALSGHPLGAWPSNVWNIANVRHNHPDRKHGEHPAMFPLELARRAVLLYTMPGQLVCDAFAGSGTSLVAAKETGRSFTGADLYYEDLRTKRLAAVAMQNTCPLPGVTDESIAIWQAEVVAVRHEAIPITTDQNEALLQTHLLF